MFFDWWILREELLNIYNEKICTAYTEIILPQTLQLKAAAFLHSVLVFEQNSMLNKTQRAITKNILLLTWSIVKVYQLNISQKAAIFLTKTVWKYWTINIKKVNLSYCLSYNMNSWCTTEFSSLLYWNIVWF